MQSAYLQGVATTWNNDTSTCVNALQRLQYTIIYNTKGRIIKVRATVDHGDITFAAPLFVKHAFAVKFIPESMSDGTSIRTRSGNPGYIMRSRVLAAKRANATLSAHPLDVPEEGFTIMDTGRAGKCESVSASGTVRSWNS